MLSAMRELILNARVRTGGLCCRLLILVVALAASASLWAEPIGYGINSRGNEQDPQVVNALWEINLATGEREYIGWTSYLDLEALAMAPDGVLYGADDDSKTLLRVSRVTGLALPVGGLGNVHNTGLPQSQPFDFGMSFDCQGRAFVVSDIFESLYLADMSDGRLTLIGNEGALGAPITDLAIRGDRAYGIGVGRTADGDPAAPNLYRIDLEQPGAELIGPLGDQASPYNNAGLAFDAEGRLWAMTDRRNVDGGDYPSEILQIDTETGQAEKVAETLVGVESLAIAPPGGCESVNGPPDIPAGVSGAHPVPALGWPAVVVGLLLFLGLAGRHFRHFRC